jgi:hypothetical protein
MTKRYVYVSEAEIPKKHPRGVDKDHHVHAFQIICSLPDLVLSEVSINVQAVSQIATAFAVRESVLVAIFDDDVHFSTGSPCIYKTWTVSISKDFFWSDSCICNTLTE